MDVGTVPPEYGAFLDLGTFIQYDNPINDAQKENLNLLVHLKLAINASS